VDNSGKKELTSFGVCTTQQKQKKNAKSFSSLNKFRSGILKQKKHRELSQYYTCGIRIGEKGFKTYWLSSLNSRVQSLKAPYVLQLNINLQQFTSC